MYSRKLPPFVNPGVKGYLHKNLPNFVFSEMVSFFYAEDTSHEEKVRCLIEASNKKQLRDSKILDYIYLLNFYELKEFTIAL